MKNEEISLLRAAEIIRGGGLVAIPTETVYGLAANAMDSKAVARIFEAKNRPSFDPLIVHVDSMEMLGRIVASIPDDARRLMEAFWPGPLTFVLPKRPEVPDIVTSGLPTVAVRMPAHPLALELIRQTGLPLAAPSANPFGYISPTTPEHVRTQLGPAVDFILDGGPCAIGIESTILGWEDGRAVLLRLGGLPVEKIEEVIKTWGPPRPSGTPPQEGNLTWCSPSQEGNCAMVIAPGQLASHYAPRTPLRCVGREFVPPANQRNGWLGLAHPVHLERYARCEILSSCGDLREAAAGLFAAMHRLDAAPLDAIYAEVFPEVGLGRAINDRLRRAAGMKNEK